MIDRDELATLRAAQRQLDKELVRRRALLKKLREADERIRQASVHARQLQEAIQATLDFQTKALGPAEPVDGSEPQP